MRNKNKGGDAKAEKTQRLVFKTIEIQLGLLQALLDSVKIWTRLWNQLLHKIQNDPMMYGPSTNVSSNI